MRIAFYAPLKSPHHPTPSGDRHVARLLIQALETQGHDVHIASHLRSRDATGDKNRQARLKKIGEKLAARYIKKIQSKPKDQRPKVWITYHLYYKAPDWIGPLVCDALNIPYIPIEASIANKRANGPWDLSHQAVVAAVNQAECVISLNPHDTHCLPDTVRNWTLPPFIAPDPIITKRENWSQCRKAVAEKYGLDPHKQWLLAIAMMRPGDKLESYKVLSQALRGLPDLSWQLIIVGDGQARPDVEASFIWVPKTKITYTGQLDPEELTTIIPACDIYTWPAVNEAYGLAFLEAQAGGLPVIAGNTGGVPAVVADGETGLLTAPGDPVAFAAALRSLLTAPVRRRDMGKSAAQKVEAMHSLVTAGQRLDAILSTSRKDYIEPGLPLLDYAKKNKIL
ncbi:glycosyltransferase family 4 protein [Kiloniella majae]|uniref:glycosyltransferase family 4 protein n=1 Tax=Kiloniella majae TaxID=1938558 RepID=UPI000A278A92|nr:glycosyltransferase family 4 protein [Kiloniella majae]